MLSWSETWPPPPWKQRTKSHVNSKVMKMGDEVSFWCRGKIKRMAKLGYVCSGHVMRFVMNKLGYVL